IGKTVQVNGHAFQVIGVSAQNFKGTEGIFTPEFFSPSVMQPWIEPGNDTTMESRSAGEWFGLGRLKQGITTKQAEVQLNSVAQQLGSEQPADDEGMGFLLTPPGLIVPALRSAVVAFSGALMVTVGLVLLIACTNLASLLLARAAARRKEIALRISIGASRIR